MEIILFLGYFVAAFLGLKVFLTIVRFARLYFLPSLGFRCNLTKLGQWAVVTGATDGIGKGYAKALARRGMSVMLISRNPTKLQDVQKEIQSLNSKIDVKILAIDFSKPSDIYSRIESGTVTMINCLQLLGSSSYRTSTMRLCLIYYYRTYYKCNHKKQYSLR